MEKEGTKEGASGDEGGSERDLIRHHHEIYPSEPRRLELDKMKAIIRCPIRERVK